MDKVYLIEDVGNSPGRIYAVFSKEKDAENFVSNLNLFEDAVEIVERTLFHGKPPVYGYNE